MPGHGGSGSAGQGGSNFILSSLNQHLDKFLVDYLGVRDSKACQDLRAQGRLVEEPPIFDFSTRRRKK